MDFTNLLKAIEEFLFELALWLVFYPMTLWRSVVRPQAMMRYAESELKDEVELQFDDTLSPPIFLLVTLLLAHGLELAFPVPNTAALPAVFQDQRNLLLFRAVAFGLFPVLFSVAGVRQTGAKLTRRSLQPAFYAQCFVAAPFVLGIYIGILLLRHGAGLPLAWAGAIVLGVSAIWYIAVQTRWLQAAGMSAIRAVATAIGVTVLGCVMLAALTAVVGLAALRLQ